MANRFQRGDLLPVFFQALGTNSPQRLNVTGWEGGREVLTFDCTHTGLGGIGTGRITGKKDGSGTISLDFDADLPAFANPYFLQEGVSGIVLEFITPLSAIQTPVVIKSLKFTSAVGSQLKYSAAWEMNVFAGLFVYPTTTL